MQAASCGQQVPGVLFHCIGAGQASVHVAEGRHAALEYLYVCRAWVYIFGFLHHARLHDICLPLHHKYFDLLIQSQYLPSALIC
jgi:hypothetical protein